MARVLIPMGAHRYNDHLHYGFWARCFQSQGHEVHLYGEHADRGVGFQYPTYEPKRPMSDVAREVDPDLFVCLGTHVDWQGWKQVRCARAAVECDFQYVHSLKPYAGADVLFVRSLRSVARARGFQGRDKVGLVHWAPLSVYQPPLQGESPRRRPRVFFAGAQGTSTPYRKRGQWVNLKDGPYPVRRAAIKQLREAGLLARESVVNGYVPTTEYYNLCRRFVFGLACSTVWRYLPVKHLEYAAAGCAVLTDGAPGLDLLLPPKGYLLYTPETVVSLVREIVEDEGRLRQVVQNARQAQQHVLRYHTDETRSAEICSLLEDRGIL